MPAITSLGIGSGADLNSLVTQLVAVERQPLQQMRSQAAGLQTQVSSYGKLSSLLSNLQTAANKLNDPSLWTKSSAKSSDETAVSVVGGSGAAAGSYSVSVSKLATSQTVSSAASVSNSSALVGAGSMTLQIGTWQDQPMNFVPHVGRDSMEIDIAPTDTLANLRDKINGLGAGVTASLVSDSTGVRLAMRSTATGEENGFRLQVNDADSNAGDGAGLSRYAYDPAGASAGMETKVMASNAQAVVNGIAVNSASNDLSGVVDGVTFRLRKENFGSAEVAVNSDTESVKAAIQGFATSYNELAKTIADQTRYDATSKTGGPLQGDSAVGSLSRQLRSLINTPSAASSSMPRLSDLGLEMQRDGSLSVNATKLDKALTNPTELKKALTNVDATNTGNAGFARRYADMATQVLGVDGTLTTRTESLQKLLTQNSDAQSRLNDRVDRFQARMVQQYTQLDGKLSQLNALSSSVTQQLNKLSVNYNNN